MTVRFAIGAPVQAHMTVVISSITTIVNHGNLHFVYGNLHPRELLVKNTTTSADSLHNNKDKMDAEMDASSGTLLPRRVIHPVGKTAASKRKAKVLHTANLP